MKNEFALEVPHNLQVIKQFSGIDWKNPQELALIWHHVREENERLIAEMEKSGCNGEYIARLIMSLAVNKVIALFLQTKLDAAYEMLQAGKDSTHIN
jgi:hypothetical protein